MAKKMLLIDPRLLESMTQKQYAPPDTLNDNLRDLDDQMQQVLEREDLLPHDKAKMYQQTLQRYLTRIAQYRNKSLGLVDIKPPPPIPTSEHQQLLPTTPLLKAEDVDKSLHSSLAVDITDKVQETPATSSYTLRRRKKKSKIPTPKWEKWPLE